MAVRGTDPSLICGTKRQQRCPLLAEVGEGIVNVLEQSLNSI